MEDTLQEITPIDVSYQPIELCKLLKIANMVGGGGEAKIVISEGYVYVNGEVEFQKRKKIFHQDIVEFNGEVISVQCSAPVQDAKAQKAAKAKKLSQSVNNNQQNDKSMKKTKKKQSVETGSDEVIETTVASGKRKRISF
ncbi:RNA-binding S4 domain-containing protein [Thalassotalea castellviae]|uniref:RNA-binding S4 domain-containing protein n=1 Tax=Thalassotalea castellviae TaxID=3075612 RepID=A0ABU3A3P3_9GAMM|nr:RNA-binding S4 domain-containing protein [Thalassotalea sp. W431]MDT0604797.1 RNA-binding S4 domain-containing protein [Thalassotalea sp. W431]